MFLIRVDYFNYVFDISLAMMTKMIVIFMTSSRGEMLKFNVHSKIDMKFMSSEIPYTKEIEPDHTSTCKLQKPKEKSTPLLLKCFIIEKVILLNTLC